MTDYSALSPRKPTVRLTRKGGPGRPRADNPLFGAYEAVVDWQDTVEFDLPPVNGRPDDVVAHEIVNHLRRAARWLGHGRPTVRFDFDKRIFQVTARPK